MSFLRKFTKLLKKPWWNSLKVADLVHPNLLKWNPTMSVFLEITEIIFWWIFQNSYYIESFQIIDKICSGRLVIFLKLGYIFIQDIGNGKTFHLLSIFYFNILMFRNFFLAAFSHPGAAVQLINFHTQTKILTFVNTNGRPDMLTRKVFNEKFI